MHWQEVKEKLNKEAESIEFTPPDEVVRLFKHQIVPSGQGVGGQAFTTMVFCEGDCRSLAYYGVLCLVRLVDDPLFTLEHMKALYKEFVPLSAQFQGTCGLEKLWELVQDVSGSLDTVKTKDEIKELLDALGFYVSMLHGWVHHYFPWYIGELFPQRKADEVKEMAALMK
jgi:hypothetical protein